MGSARPDISSIRALVARARRRVRVQAALEGAATATVLAAATALVAVYAVRAYIVTPGTGVALLLASVGVIVAGAIVGALRTLDDEEIARRVDRASNLSDRLSTAIAFDDALRTDAPVDPARLGVDGELDHEETRELMRAAMRDAVRSTGRADLQRATPYTLPADAPIAGVFAVLAALAAGIGLPDRDPACFFADPRRGPRGAEVTIDGDWLCGPDKGEADACRGDRRVVIVHRDQPVGEAPVLVWRGGSIEVVIPDDAPIGWVHLEAWIDGRPVDRVPFEVIDPVEEKKNNPDAPTWDPDDRSYTRDLLDELRATAKRDDIPELEDYVKRVEELLQLADQGEISKEQLLEELEKAEKALHQGEEPDQKEVDKDLAETGKELAKNELTKELGKALEQNDLEKAKQELEKLAEKMENGELTDKQKQDLAKAMEKAAREFQKKQDQRDKQQNEQIQKAERELKKLEKERDEAKTPKEKEDAERRLEKKKRELDELKKEKDQKEQSEQRRALKRLHKDMEDAAKDLQQKSDSQEQDQENQRQASQKMKSAAQETGRVDRDKRKTATTKKVSSQMDDLREAMRRAKRRGNKGPQNPFGKNGKQSDFERRARGQKGSKQAWKPGQGQDGKGKGKGQGQGQNGGDAGDPQESDTWGVGHDPDMTGDPTAKSGDTQDEDVQGIHGKGPSRRETILSAAQKGFASKGYEKVYADYKEIVEEVMRSEKVPSSYKYYIKKYFTKIKPHSMD